MNKVFLLLALAAPLACAFLLGPFFASQARAHAVHAQSPAGVHPQVVAFEYATGDIPAYVQVEVYAPGETEVEFQNGRTDALGRFTFTPDKPGVWTVVMGDGMGHQLRHEVTVPEALFAEATAPTNPSAPATAATPATATSGGLASLSTPWKALVGVSVLCNIFLGMGLWRRRHAPAAKS